MSRALLTPGACAVAILLALSLDGPGRAQLAPGRQIDRTFVCTAELQAGVHELHLAVRSGVRSTQRPGHWRELAGLVVTTHGVPSPGHERSLVAAASAGRHETNVHGGLAISASRCTARRGRVPLVPAGLGSEPATRLGDAYECAVPRQVVLRVRGTFSAPTRLHRNALGSLSTSGGYAREARMVVATLAGKRIAYASVDESGRARIFLGAGCFPD